MITYIVRTLVGKSFRYRVTAEDTYSACATVARETTHELTNLYATPENKFSPR